MADPISTTIGVLNLIGSAASAVQGNQNRQRAKGQIDAAFKLGRERLQTKQQDLRRSQAESLVSRGLAQGGIRLRTKPVDATNRVMAQPGYAGPSGVRIVMNPKIDPGPGTVRNAPETVTAARTLGEQQQLDLAREQQVEQDALVQQRDAARAGVDAGYAQGLVGAIGSGVSGAIDAYRVGQMKPPAVRGEFGIDPIAPWEQGTVDNFTIFNQRG